MSHVRLVGANHLRNAEPSIAALYANANKEGTVLTADRPSAKIARDNGPYDFTKAEEKEIGDRITEIRTSLTLVMSAIESNSGDFSSYSEIDYKDLKKWVQKAIDKLNAAEQALYRTGLSEADRSIIHKTLCGEMTNVARALGNGRDSIGRLIKNVGFFGSASTLRSLDAQILPIKNKANNFGYSVEQVMNKIPLQR